MDNELLQYSRKSGLSRLFSNTAAILTSDASNRIATFITYALIARFLGVHEFGQMALGFIFFHSFQLLSVAGLQSLIIREVSKEPKETKKYLVNANIVVFCTSILAIICLRLLTWILGYSSETTSIIMLLSIGLFPFSLSIIYDALFKAREKMYYVGISNLAINIVKVVLLYIFLQKGADLNHVIILFLFTYFAAMIIKLFFLLRLINKIKEKFNLRFCLTMAKSSTTFFGINSVNAAMNSFIVILLSKLASEVEVGLFSAANQLMTPVVLAFESITVSVYPAMCRSFKNGIHRLKKISERVLEVFVAIVLPSSIVLFFLADSFLLILYGKKDFSLSADVLKIMVWGLVLRAAAKVFGVVLIASMQERKTLRILTVDLLTMIIFGYIFVSQYGLIGCAVTMVLVRIIDFIQHFFPVNKLFSGFPLIRLTWIQILASFCMALCFLLMHGYNPIITTISASTIYLSVLFFVMVFSAGGIDKIKARYLYLKPGDSQKGKA